MISENSRYAGRATVLLPHGGGPRLTILPAEPDDITFRYTYYQWADNDRIDLVAYGFYGDPTLWSVIAEANPEILVWSRLAAGTVIRIPGA